MKDRAIVTLNLMRRHELHDIDVPLDINASELLEGLNVAYKLGLKIDDSSRCYIAVENPLVLIHGRKTLAEYGVMNGSIINIAG
jgi:uncharacterized ubiquitin-like protein YukD